MRLRLAASSISPSCWSSVLVIRRAQADAGVLLRISRRGIVSRATSTEAAKLRKRGRGALRQVAASSSWISTPSSTRIRAGFFATARPRSASASSPTPPRPASASATGRAQRPSSRNCGASRKELREEAADLADPARRRDLLREPGDRRRTATASSSEFIERIERAEAAGQRIRGASPRMRITAAARRYARALFSLAKEEKIASRTCARARSARSEDSPGRLARSCRAPRSLPAAAPQRGAARSGAARRVCERLGTSDDRRQLLLLAGRPAPR